MIKPVPQDDTYARQVDSAVLNQLLGNQPSTVYVSEQSVGGLPAIGRGIDMVSNAVATMLSGAQVYRQVDVPMEAPPVLKRPNVLYGAHEFWMMVIQSLMYRGNFVGIKADLDEMGYPRQIVPVHIDAVHMDMTSGLPQYQINDEKYGYDDVIHIRANAPVGTLWGMGVVEQYRTNLEGQLYEQQYGSNSFKSGAVPSAVITLDADRVEEETATAVQEGWVAKHGAGERKPAVVPRTMSITPIGFSHKDAEFISGKQLSIAECALMVGIDPADLTASIGGMSMTYANLQSRQIARITDSYSKWMNLTEERWSDLIEGAQEVRGDAEALLRTSTKERVELHGMAIAQGWRTPEEVRAIEGLPVLSPLAESKGLIDSGKADLPPATQGEA